MQEKIYSSKNLHYLEPQLVDNIDSKNKLKDGWYLETSKGFINVENIVSINDLDNEDKYLKDSNIYGKRWRTNEEFSQVDSYLKNILGNYYISLVGNGFEYFPYQNASVINANITFNKINDKNIKRVRKRKKNYSHRPHKY